MTTQTKPRELTGRKVLAITLGFFGVIIAVNLVMAYSAVSTFPGLEVRNSYIASQGFNERMRAQQALGWSTEADLTGGRLTLRLTTPDGNPAPVADIQVLLGRPTTTREDLSPELHFADGAFIADVDVDEGNWDLRITAQAGDGTAYAYRIGLIHNR